MRCAILTLRRIRSRRWSSRRRTSTRRSFATWPCPRSHGCHVTCICTRHRTITHWLSECLHGHRSRAGETQSWSSPIAELDVSKLAPRQDLGHGYITNSRVVALDIARVLGSPTAVPHAPSDLHTYLAGVSWLGRRSQSIGDITGRKGIDALCSVFNKLGFS